MPLFPVCSPRLLEPHPELAGRNNLPRGEFAAAPLASIPLLCEDRDFDLWQAWYGTQAKTLTNPRRIIADANVRTQAAIDGLGWTLADSLMQRELVSGALVAPFSHRLDGYGYAIEVPASRYISRNAVELRDWLIGQA